RPRPRPPKSPAQVAKIRVQNRRREYLVQNPRYFSNSEHEFADPDLYDKLMRHFQTPAEREAEGRTKGWGKTLESSLLRGEARLERVASSYTGDVVPRAPSNGAAGTSNFDIDSALAEKPASREEGRAAWEEFLRERFVAGGDEEFDYDGVDGDDELDSMEDRDREEAYFDEEEPAWADDSEEDEDGEGRPKRERLLLGETGIQDY
ncbi:hypothetical protein M406DRAFT_242678, partial [Cryphonectria parasitica EP155]